jgi:hypothetical protein
VYWGFKYDSALLETLIMGLASTELPHMTATGNKYALLSTDDNDSWHCAVNCNSQQNTHFVSKQKFVVVERKMSISPPIAEELSTLCDEINRAARLLAATVV